VKNPEEQLDQLRRSSVLEFEHLKSPEHPTAPLRDLPEHSVDSAELHHLSLDGTADANKTNGAEKPLFKEPDFGAEKEMETRIGAAEDVLSPTER
jgi:glycogenin glucosyltransferase